MSIVLTPAPATTNTATALDIIKRAMRLIGVYAIGEEPSADETRDALQALNAMLDAWAVNSLLIYAPTLDAIPLTGGVESVAVGPSGDYVTERPIKVLDSSNLTYGDSVYPLDVLTLQAYNDIGQPSTAGIPSTIHCLMSMPDIVIRPWPVPSEPMTLNLWSNKQLRNFTSLTTQLALPPGYEDAITFNLAVVLAPEFEKEASPTVQRRAMNTKRMLKTANAEIPELEFDSVLIGRR